jgi:acetolactate synthase-1/2/3 large subunit
MCIQELATGVINKLPIKIMILNNSYLGMVRQWQDMDLTGNPDFVKLAEAYGAVGLRAMTPDEVVPVLEQAMEVDDRPTVIDVSVIQEENVFPMIPAGKSFEELLECPVKPDK